MREKYL